MKGITHPCHPLRMKLSRAQSQVQDFVGHYRSKLIENTVCRVQGHRQDKTAALLGFCSRCYTNIPTEKSRAMWASLTERYRLEQEATDRTTVFKVDEKPLNPSVTVQIGDMWIPPSGVLHRWDGNDWMEQP